MFMGNQDGVNRGQIFTDRRKPFRSFAPAQPSIDQQPGSIGRNEGRIASATAREYADLDDGASPFRLFLSDVIAEF